MVQEDGSFKWTVEGSEEKTSIEQTDELVEIKCKDFKVSTSRDHQDGVDKVDRHQEQGHTGHRKHEEDGS